MTEKQNSQNAVFFSRGHKMTRKEVRNVITPYEFGISEDLIGTSLAKPSRRGIAILIDLLFIAILTSLPNIILALLSGIAFWRAGRQEHANISEKWLRRVFGFIAIILFLVVIGMLMDRFSNDIVEEIQDRSSASEVVSDIAVNLMIKSLQSEAFINQVVQGDCDSGQCWRDYTSSIAEEMAEQQIPPVEVDEVFDNIAQVISDTDAANATASEVKTALMQVYRANYVAPSPEDLNTSDDPSIDDDATQEVLSTTQPVAENKKFEVPNNDEGDPSLLRWILGIAEDFGIGFGWSALYFTVFAGWWRGQTPGKKICKIKVIKLDGNSMTLWESFERYGGYGAGIATGLLGFIQIYWDANRQAIQDKIAETLVIHLGQPKVDVWALDKQNTEADQQTS
ncbi:RDD family protein [Glaciecola sp. 1036]|uniref:RDD family protein n=1 Tax=Alteromonadaceae TaxID=72275 RepID=UPI003D08FA8E